ncbi:phage tail tube protein [Granulibacter bethesdensis]|uniref:phage tail tube protein n=1 Tax=Granulibacter bethesdensis TaxID=364410 RepID=UPI0003F1E927|nr:phage tail tube protein [Granulibacter bethesdensis]AHJ66370.1 Hypothetical protein GbCGDNIH4_7166 [Granulibacter bethesdensis CGDNIH4]
MAGTSGYSAGAQTTDAEMSYAVETLWGGGATMTPPATAFQAVRITSETLKINETRQTSNEVRKTRDTPARITSQETAGGDISFEISYATFDDFFSAALGNDWTAPQDIVLPAASGGVTPGLSLDVASNKLSANVALFSAIPGLGWVRLQNFANAANNEIFQVRRDSTATALKFTAANTVSVTETPAYSATKIWVRAGGSLVNGNLFKSIWLQKRLSSGLFLQYPGSYPTQFSLRASVGQALTGSVTLVSKTEYSSSSSLSTGNIVAAPQGLVMQPTNGVQSISVDGAPVSAIVKDLSIQIANTGAAGQYGFGSGRAQGMLQGSIEVSGSMGLFMRDLSLRDYVRNKQTVALSFLLVDGAGQAYGITLPACQLINPAANITGKNAPVDDVYTLEANPDPTSGITIQIDKVPAASA